MQYLGGKGKIAKKLINLMSTEREEGMTWVEPFMGSAKVISKVKGRRIGNDINHEIITLFKRINEGYEPPRQLTEEQYNHIKANQDLYPDELKGFVSFGCSFGGKRWDSYAKNKRGDNYCYDSYLSLMRMKPSMDKVELFSGDYKDLTIPENSLIYCDPPYKNTTGYGYHFNHEEFYVWCKDKVKEGHKVFVSEYEAPFELAWSKQVNVTLNKNQVIKKVEKLYRVHKEQPFKLRGY